VQYANKRRVLIKMKNLFRLIMVLIVQKVIKIQIMHTS